MTKTLLEKLLCFLVVIILLINVTTSDSGDGDDDLDYESDGVIKFSSPTDSSVYFRIKIDKIEQYNGNDKIAEGDDFNVYNSSWSSSTLVNNSDITAYYNYYNAQVNMKLDNRRRRRLLEDTIQTMDLNLETYFFIDNSTVQYGNTSKYTYVQANNFKWSFSFSNYASSNITNSSLYVLLKFETSGLGDSFDEQDEDENGDVSNDDRRRLSSSDDESASSSSESSVSSSSKRRLLDDDDDDDSDEDHDYKYSKKKFIFANASLTFPTIAEVDGVITNITVNYLSYEDNELSVEFWFPAFQNKIFYDPVACIGSCDSASTTTTTSSGRKLQFNALVFVGFIIIISFILF